MVETDFWSCGNYFLLFNFFFLQVETFTEIGKDFVPIKRTEQQDRTFTEQLFAVHLLVEDLSMADSIKLEIM